MRAQEPPINARPVGAAMVAAITAAVTPLVVTPPVEAATFSPTDTGSFRSVDLGSLMAARAEHARADRSRGLYPPAPRHIRPAAVQVAVVPPAPPASVQVVSHQPRPAAPPARRAPRSRNAGSHYAAPAASGSGSAVLRFAMAQVGDRYAHGAVGPNVWDCSGLTMAAALQVGVHLPHNADAQRAHVRHISRAELQPGDLVFYSGHVAVYAGNGMQVAAANTREGVVYQPMYGTPSMYGRLN